MSDPSPRYLIANRVADLTTVVALAPLDTLLTRVQLGGVTNRTALISTVRLEGPLALYKGMSIALLQEGTSISKSIPLEEHSLPSLTAEFNKRPSADSNNPYRPFSNPYRPFSNPLQPLLVYSLVGMTMGCMTWVGAPIALLRTRLQMQVGKQLGPLGIARHIVSTRGVPGLWTGGRVIMLRDVLGFGVRIPAMGATEYELLQRGLEPRLALSLAIGLSDLVYWAVAMPFDCLRAHIQTSDEAVSIRKAFEHFNSSLPRLYRGYPLAAVRGTITAAILVAVDFVAVDAPKC